ncbi:MAG TPA: UDP-3-O-acyl-N-acetylglucosamine deacetylase, partial [bacterium]|nr:UDP-3-O-acyl-N-acetylglucosamine deacetylase [bacterium]
MLCTLDQPQTTLGGPVELAGEGVFTGRPCRVRLEPASADHGLVLAVQGHRIPVRADRLITHPNRSTLVAEGDPTVGANM